ncbi:helix-hairpin-helix domain-containing protein [Mucilaginibacter sp. RS28]|uniref:Helix-hairpin-helix domain-containing protein n=1 Tax=Mucilaginibacter straminoryzae TaxID=2932774 RepID=A0A9X2B9B2_9SPHI|nr:helix-hairpin-helix domain-containing protein [Mucilaginibacter straminoryzae]MCJ8210301.1 helix-hairpin-helix domain-containing protein [Mucilaginibacter straminoryzae]
MIPNLKNYLSLSKKEWNGLVVLVSLIILTMAAPSVYSLFHKDKIINFSEFDKAAALLKYNKAGVTSSAGNLGDTVHLFKFNPNKLSVQKWLQLGLSERQAGMITHYLEKGGHFYKKADLKKIYSISEADYTRLAPYIELPDAEEAIPVIELNHADSASLTRLKGIGPGFAMRIIRYRDKIGGFHSKQQLKEVFGIDEEHYLLVEKQVKVNASLLKKLNINKATFDDLRRYPYLTYKQVNAILQYRNEHGDYENLADMEDVAILDKATLQKLKPYLVFK